MSQNVWANQKGCGYVALLHSSADTFQCTTTIGTTFKTPSSTKSAGTTATSAVTNGKLPKGKYKRKYDDPKLIDKINYVQAIPNKNKCFWASEKNFFLKKYLGKIIQE